MNLQTEQTHIVGENKSTLQQSTKRKYDDTQEPNKRCKDSGSENSEKEECLQILAVDSKISDDRECVSKGKTFNGTPSTSLESVTKSPEKKQKLAAIFIPKSPKKRLELNVTTKSANKTKEKFIYGNYSQYYGYRNKDRDFHDIRLDVFEEYKELFKNKEVLDIGCNSGFITMEVAKRLDVKSIVGLDIDKHLINQAMKSIIRHKKALPMNNELKRLHKFPFNVSFVQGNYVLRDAVLLEIERPQFEVILCLSITKWIHLNFGDNGLKMAFKRMFLQLQPKGVLVLEAQPFDNYGRRKKMTDTIFANYKNMKFLPKDFDEFLLSSEVGFTKMVVMGVPDHCKKGFKRPIQIFYKE